MDNTGLILEVFDKTGKLVAQGQAGSTTVTISGLTAGQQVAEGDYQVVFTDGTVLSDPAKVPAFTVPAGN